MRLLHPVLSHNIQAKYWFLETIYLERKFSQHSFLAKYVGNLFQLDLLPILDLAVVLLEVLSENWNKMSCYQENTA